MIVVSITFTAPMTAPEKRLGIIHALDTCASGNDASAVWLRSGVFSSYSDATESALVYVGPSALMAPMIPVVSECSITATPASFEFEADWAEVGREEVLLCEPARDRGGLGGGVPMCEIIFSAFILRPKPWTKTLRINSGVRSG